MNTPMTYIRQAIPEDVPWILDLGRALHDEAPTMRWLPEDELRRYRVVSTVIQSSDALFVVLDDQSGFIIGHVEQHAWHGATVVYEDILYIIPDKRKTYRAKILLQALFDWARLIGAAEVVVEITSGIETEKSVRFCEKMGMEVIGTVLRMEV